MATYPPAEIHPAHAANIHAKAVRACQAIATIAGLLIERGTVADRLAGLRYMRHALVALNSPEAWALVANQTGDTEFRSSREDIMIGLEAMIDAERAGVDVSSDPFKGLGF